MMRSFRLKPSTVHERFGDETVILNLDSGSYYSAQGTATAIWSLVTDGVPEAGILQRVRAEYAGNSEEIAGATARFLDQLVAEALVEADNTVDGGADRELTIAAAPSKNDQFSLPLLQKYTDMEEMLLLDPIHEVDEHGWPSARRVPD
ncbi:MAG: PqqD family protein [Xanthobacteraceae bacterium]|nr:PqqD family protein [Xanthobacteraceae bacterium]